ncbi:MAG: hypothetical protein K2X82_31815 [Gemmataceae bacterium]|nr:hypothetical protein [Gemmataceae bacterium]
MHAFTVHPQKPASPPPAAPPRRRWLVVLALLLAAGLTAGALRRDPHLARVKALQKELFTPEAKNLPAADRKAKFEELRTEMKQLTDDQKWDLAAPMREKQKAEMDRYFALSPNEKTAYLDRRLDREEQFRKEIAKKGGPGGRPPGGGGGGGGFGGPPGGGAGNGSGKAAPSPEQADQRRRQMLDRTTPEERAQRDAFRKDMDARRRQRGLPSGRR